MLTPRKKTFIEHYKLTRNASESARRAGYSLKCCRQLGSRLLTDNDVKAALEAWEAEETAKIEQIKRNLSKDSFVENAMRNYENLPPESPNKPRFLEMAGKALGYIRPGAKDNRPDQTLNMEVNLTGNETYEELLARVRRIIGND